MTFAKLYPTGNDGEKVMLLNKKKFLFYSKLFYIFVLVKQNTYIMIVHNNVEDTNVFKGNESQFIDFMKKIVIENEDYDFSIIGLSDAIEYLEDYCSNLELIDDN
jgi:hypothetical protein